MGGSCLDFVPCGCIVLSFLWPFGPETPFGTSRKPVLISISENTMTTDPSSVDSARKPTDRPARRFPTGIVVTLTCLLLLWAIVIWALLNTEYVEDQVPTLTTGVVELIAYGLGIVSVGAVAVALIWNFSGRWRWVFLLVGPIAIAGLLMVVLRHYRIVFDADMNPLRIDAVDSEYELKPRSELQPDSLVAGPTDFPRYLGQQQDLTIDWLRWREWPSGQSLNVPWRRSMGYAWSGFTAVGDLAFTMEQKGPWECVTAYSIATGELVWAHRDRHRHDDPAGGIGPRSTPTFSQGKLFTLGAHGTLNCLEATTGNLIWQIELTEKFDIPLKTFHRGTDQQYDVEQTNVLWGRAASPLVVNDLVIVPVGGVKDDPASKLRSLVAFSVDDGTVVWESGNQQISYGSATLANLAGKPQILITNEATISGHDVETGKQLWIFDRTGDSGGPANTSQPIVLPNNQVLTSKGYGLGGELTQIAVDQHGQWTTETVWKNSRVLKTKLTVPVVQGNYAYCVSGGRLECTDWRTGERQWRGERVQHGQLLLIDGRLLVVSESGDLLVLKATPEACEILHQVDGLLSGRCWNMLCVTGNLLIARSDLEAVCVELPAEIILPTEASRTRENTHSGK